MRYDEYEIDVLRMGPRHGKTDGKLLTNLACLMEKSYPFWLLDQSAAVFRLFSHIENKHMRYNIPCMIRPPDPLWRPHLRDRYDRGDQR
jgi:hypothetical protein